MKVYLDFDRVREHTDNLRENAPRVLHWLNRNGFSLELDMPSLPAVNERVFITNSQDEDFIGLVLDVFGRDFSYDVFGREVAVSLHVDLDFSAMHLKSDWEYEYEYEKRTDRVLAGYLKRSFRSGRKTA